MIIPAQLQKPHERQMYAFLFILTIACVASFQAWTTLYTSYAVEFVGLDSVQNGFVQAAREIPGILGIGVVGLLLFMRESTLSALSVVTMGLGVVLTGLFPSYGGLLFCTVSMSFGFYYAETVNQSLILQTYDRQKAPLVMGSLRSSIALANMCMGLVLLLSTRFLSYQYIFFVAGSLALLAGGAALFHLPDTSALPRQNHRMVFRSRYKLFYALTFLSGARRQLLTVFVVFLLVERFQYGVTEMTLLFLVTNACNWILNPLIGRAINQLGERFLLTLEAVVVLFVLAGYMLATSALLVVALYIVDQIVYNFSLAVRTFFQKMADPADIAPSMALSVTINHVAGVLVPAVGGLLWLEDYRYVFALGMCIALCVLVLAQGMDKALRPQYSKTRLETKPQPALPLFPLAGSWQPCAALTVKSHPRRKRMLKTHRALAFVLMLGLALIAVPVAAQAAAAATTSVPTPGKPTPDKPSKTSERKTQISVTHEGTDSTGARLSTRLKELFNSSNLFQLNEKDAPKMRILLDTKAEFAERPNVGSVYSIIWIFSQSEGHLGYLLAHDMGTLSPEDVDNAAAKIMERTDGIAVKYGYLFQ